VHAYRKDQFNNLCATPCGDALILELGHVWWRRSADGGAEGEKGGRENYFLGGRRGARCHQGRHIGTPRKVYLVKQQFV